MEIHVLLKDKAVLASTYIPCYEDVWGPGDIASHIVNLGTGWMMGVDRYMPQPLCSEEGGGGAGSLVHTV
jgi:hypothetical protein